MYFLNLNISIVKNLHKKMPMIKVALFSIILLLSINTSHSDTLFSTENTPDYKKILEKYNLKSVKKIGISKFFNDKAKETYLKDYNDKFIILNFWANWCIECLSELKSLNQLKIELDKLKINDIQIIAICDNTIDFEKLKNVYQSHKINSLDIYFDPNRNLMNEFKIHSPPSTLFIDKEGKIFARFNNTYNWSDQSIIDYILNIKDKNH